MPILAGMTAGFTGMVPAAFGCIFYFFLKHTADYVALSSSSAEGDLIEGYKYIFQHLVQDKLRYPLRGLCLDAYWRYWWP